MGLDLDSCKPGLAFLRRGSTWWYPALLIVSSGVLELIGEGARVLLRYDRTAIPDFEFWRLVSGHFVHLGPSHYMLNALGLILVWLLVGGNFTIRQWLLVTLVSIAGVSAGLWFLDAGLSGYVGMSGILHGMLAAGSLVGLRTARRESLLIGAVILVKIGFEQLFGPLPGSEESAGGHVVVNAHLYGALAGVGTAAVFWKSSTSKPPRQ
jgi:rhomboid family GlyGly-CTERM serine protease